MTNADIKDRLSEYLGEGIHTAFRKVGDSTESSEAWDAISRMDDSEWAAVVGFVADAMVGRFNITDRLDTNHSCAEDDGTGSCCKACGQARRTK